MSLVAGARLGPYEVLGPLGAGGMGEVYRARDTRLDRIVAIKVLPAHVSPDLERKARFEREARTVASLNHPHICVLHDVGHQDGVDFLVMEYLEGETLAERVTKGALPIDQVLRYGTEIADALARAHREHIVHRDLKPANVLLTKAGAKLLDFGLAKTGAPLAPAPSTESHSPTATRGLTAEGTLLGTFQYMSPEQLEGKEADHRADIWALGCVLYEMATGKRAFGGKSQASLISAIMTADPQPISQLQPMTPPALDRLIPACLAKDPDDRMQSAHDVARELAWMREGSEVSAGPTAPGNGRGFRHDKVRWVSAALAVGIVAGMWVGRRWPPDRSPDARGMSPPVTRTVIELSAASLGMGAASVGFNSTLLALSPDGKLLVYAGESAGVTRLYRRALDRFDESRPIAGTEGAIHAFFSPDGRSLGFLTDNKVKRVSVEGDDLRTLCDARSPVQGSWTRNHTIYFAEEEGASLRRIGETGGQLEKIELGTLRDRSIYFGDALPDGKTVLVTERTRSVSLDYGPILAFDVETHRSRVLVESGYDPRYAASGHLLFARSGNIMAVGLDPDRVEVRGEPVPVLRGVAMDSLFGHAQIAISASGSLAYAPGGDRAIGRLARVDRKGRVEILPAGPEHYGQLDLSPDGTKLAVHVADVNDYVWIWDLKRNEGRRLTGSAPAGWPIWDPTGEVVALTAWSSESRQVIQTQPVAAREPSGALLERSEPGFGYFGVHSWVGAKLSIVDGLGERGHSGILSITGAASVKWEEALCIFGAISRDGRWMACYRGGQVSMHSLADPRLARQISTDGGIEPRWCRACNLLFFRKGNRWLATSVSFEPELRWDPPRVVFETDFLDTPGLSYDVSPDGQFLYVVKPAASDERDKVNFVTGWLAELTGLVPGSRLRP